MHTYVIGGSTFGLTVAELVKRCGGFDVAGFFDDMPQGLPAESRLKHVGPVEALSKDFIGDCRLVMAIGANSDRAKVFARLEQKNVIDSLISIIDPSAIVLGAVTFGKGCIVFPGAVVGPNTTIGDGAVLNANSFVGAFCSLGDFINVCPGACVGSSSVLGDYVYLGMGASVQQGLTVAPNVVIGSGSTVVSSINGAGTFAGTPARQIEIG